MHKSNKATNRLYATDWVLIATCTICLMVFCFAFGLSQALQMLRLGKSMAIFTGLQSALLIALAYGGFWYYILHSRLNALKISIVAGSIAGLSYLLPVLLIS